MPKQRVSKKAAQLSPQDSGVSKWQRDFWLALVEHALGGGLGAPDLSRLEGFLKPAVIRHAVTTPELWHSFDKYNAGKPYHRQVRPFGFMVMFQQDEELLEPSVRAPVGNRSSIRSGAMLRVIAPFNRNPVVAARLAFDRDTGNSVSPKSLKTYIRALRHYHDHPEAKFLNGERADRGPTVRRHVVVRSIRHIGKEANRLDSQITMGTDPKAQAEFGVALDGRKKRVSEAEKAVANFGPAAVARAANISRQHLFAVTRRLVTPTEAVLCRIEQALAALQSRQALSEISAASVRGQIGEMVQRIGLRRSAQNLGISAGHLSRILSEERTLGTGLMHKIASSMLQIDEAEKRNYAPECDDR